MNTAVFGLILSLIGILLHGVVIFAVLLTERRQPSATLAWILTIIFLPVIGAILYFFIGSLRARRVARAHETVERHLRAVLARHPAALNSAAAPLSGDHRTQGFLSLCRRLATTPASPGNQVKILVNGAMTYRKIFEAIDGAKSYVHVEYYIVQPDEVGEDLRDRLARKARQGVRVRVVVDGLGSMALPVDFWNDLTEAGGEVTAFRPMRGFFWRTLTRLSQPDRVDFRNHRKIVVVDGVVGFTGGINIGREYLGLDPVRANWRDTHLEIRGPAVLGLQAAFLEDWMVATEAESFEEDLIPDPTVEGDAVVQIVDSGPDRTWSPITYALLFAYGSATERIWITSPYFVPSQEILAVLETAALRGVDVRILVPAEADHLLVHMAAWAFYPRLIEAGIRVFQYESAGWRFRRKGKRGFMHAKTMVIDRWLGTVGSSNLDMRSFNLNFELNAFVLQEEVVDELARQFTSDCQDATELTAQGVAERSVWKRAGSAAARLLAPLL